MLREFPGSARPHRRRLHATGWNLSGTAPISLALGILFALALPPASALAVEPSTDHDVVIVGAGVAGLYAAYTLTNLGYDVLVVEASGRHGGRLFSSSLGDVRVENGAEELYGNNGGNPIFTDLVAAYGAGAHATPYQGKTLLVMDGDGSNGGPNVCTTPGDCYLDSDIYDYWDFYYEYSDGSHSGDATDEVASTILAAAPYNITPSSRNWHLFEGGAPASEYATSVTKLGMRSLARQPFTLGGAIYGLNVSGMGYLDVLNALYFTSILSKVTLNSPVTVIDTTGDKPVAIDSNGVYHYADAIISAVGLGVLKAGIIDFIPNLPAAKLTAIATIGMGNGMKIPLRFSSRFWGGGIGQMVLDGPSGFCYTPGDYQAASSDHVLMCYSMGSNAEVFEAMATDQDIIDGVLADLDNTFGGSTATNAYIEGYVNNWTANPWVRGAYSFPAPGTYPDVGDSMYQILADQVGTTLYFAGEATSNTKAATVPGAMLSGERAAGEADTDIGGPPAIGTPDSDFSASVTLGAAPLDVDFTDQSSGTPTGWSWNFGDTGTSSSQHPSHQYTTPGTYTVSLAASSPNGSHTRVLPNLIEVTLGGTVCGDGNLDAGEECDDSNTTGGDGCSSICEVEVCGNGVLDAGEGCDDSNIVGGDGCSSTCEIEVCGNGVLDVGEGCDDSNIVGGDGCSSICEVEVCGNGTLDVGEACDDSNMVSGDGCSSVCVVEFCSDGILQLGLGEQCDDGNTTSEDGCSATCQDEFCGDTTVQAGLGEECDDGNSVAGDGCSAACLNEVCGNGILDPGEGCDDGNLISGDGCSDICALEPAPTANFSADVTSGNAPMLVTFSDASTDAPTSWLWDFGEIGATSTDQNPAHDYTVAGTFTVSLTSTNASGSDIEVKTDYIVVPEPGVIVQLSVGIFLLASLHSRRQRR